MNLYDRVMANPREALLQLDRLDCADSLLTFTKQGWHALEPGTEFVTGWAVEAMAEHLQAVTNGEIRDLCINVPPGFTKSMLVNVFWPAWEWGPRAMPHLRYISASYDKTLSTRDLVRCRDLLASEWYQARWPMRLKVDEDAKTYYVNQDRGWRFASSVGSSMIGWRGDRIIIDDPHSVKTAESDAQRGEARRWFTETLPTRLNHVMKSRKVLVMQRLHMKDLSALAKELGWTMLVLPMEYECERKCRTTVVFRGKPFEDPRTEEGELLWPERFPRQAVEDLKRAFRLEGGSYAEAGQLQQRPVPREGGLFRVSWFPIREIPSGTGWRWCRGWDLAATREGGAWTAGVLMGMSADGERIRIGDVCRLQGSPRDVEIAIQRCARQDGMTVRISIPQDPGQAALGQKARLASLLHGHVVHFSTETGDKEDRATPFAAQAEAGCVEIAPGAWNDPYLAEIGLFPGGTKDQVDASSRAYSYLVRWKASPIGLVPGKLVKG